MANRTLKIILCLAGIGLVAACGEEGNAPDDQPNPARAAAVASYSEGRAPFASSFDLAESLYATNRGLYILAQPPVTDSASTVIKLHGDPAVAADWSSARPEVVPPGVLALGPPNIVAVAPVDPYSEGSRAFDFYWLSSGGWGRFNEGSASVRDDLGSSLDPVSGLAKRPKTIASGGSVTRRSWYVEQVENRNGTNRRYAVYQDDGVYTGAGTVADRFSTPASPLLTSEPRVVLPHPTEQLLYVAAGNGIHVYDKDKEVRSVTFSTSPDQGFTDMMWALGDLYVSYNGGVWKLVGGTGEPTLFTSLPANSPKTAGRFCITGGEIYMTNGEAVNLRTGARRDWIKRGILTASQTATANDLLQSLSGIYCSQGKVSPEIYTPIQRSAGGQALLGQSSGIRRIIPLSAN